MISVSFLLIKGLTCSPNFLIYAIVNVCEYGILIAPTSKYKPVSSILTVSMRPPTRLFASKIFTSCPAAFNKDAETNPAMPAPTTIICFGLVVFFNPLFIIFNVSSISVLYIISFCTIPPLTSSNGH